MSQDEKKLRKVASCVRTILETQGHKLRVKDIAELIKDEDLGDPVALSQKVTTDLQNRPAPTSSASQSGSERRLAIETFILDNWNLLKDNDPVRSGLFHLYTMGRLSKSDRKALANGLLTRLGEEIEDDSDSGNDAADSTPTPTADSGDGDANQLAQELLGGSTNEEEYSF
jgi:hypothetical protein